MFYYSPFLKNLVFHYIKHNVTEEHLPCGYKKTPIFSSSPQFKILVLNYNMLWGLKYLRQNYFPWVTPQLTLYSHPIVHVSLRYRDTGSFQPRNCKYRTYFLCLNWVWLSQSPISSRYLVIPFQRMFNFFFFFIFTLNERSTKSCDFV